MIKSQMVIKVNKIFKSGCKDKRINLNNINNLKKSHFHRKSTFLHFQN